jgi:hypothetical protein
MKEYVDLKFWKMFSGFVTLIALSVVILIAIKIHQNEQIEAVNAAVSATDIDQ